MAFTLYCYGDLHLFAGGLRAIAMLFDPFTGGIVGESGLQIGSLTALALLISLGGIAITGISRQRVNVDHLLVVLLLFGVMFIPKTALNIEDVISGQVDIVEDVPIGVAAVGGVVSHISLVLAENFETVFTIPSGGAAPWESGWPGMGFGGGEGGMNSPLRMLLATRKILIGDGDTYLMTDLAYFLRDCTANNFSWTDYHASPAKIEYILANHGTGTTVIYDEVLGDFHPWSCTDAKLLLKPRIDLFFADGKTGVFSQLVCANVETKPEYTGLSTACNDNAVADAYDRLMPELSGAGVKASDFMKDLMLNSAVRATIGCSAPVNEESFRLCLTTMTDAIEQSRVQNAAAASGFQKIMLTAMNVFLFLFYALSPLIAVVIAGSGMAGLSVAGKYLLFGVWSHSWLPVAVVIDYFIEASVKQELHNYALAYLNGNFDGARFYDILADHISVGSDLLAATPLVTLAILSGSMVSMTSVANRMGARDHVDETKAAPATLKNGPAWTNTYDGQTFAGKGGRQVAQDEGGVMSLTQAARDQSQTINASKVRTAGKALADQRAAQFQSAAEGSLTEGAEQLGSAMRRVANSDNTSREAVAAYNTMNSVGREALQGTTFKEDVQDRVSSAVGATLSAAADLGARGGIRMGKKGQLLSLGGDIGAKLGLSASETDQLQRALGSVWDSSRGEAFKQGTSENAQLQQTTKEGQSAIRELSASASDSIKSSAANSQKASVARSQTASETESLANTYQLGAGQGAKVADMMANAIQLGLDPAQVVAGIFKNVSDMATQAEKRERGSGDTLSKAFQGIYDRQSQWYAKQGQYENPAQRNAIAAMEAVTALANGNVLADTNGQQAIAQAGWLQTLQDFAPQLNLGAANANAGVQNQVQGGLARAAAETPGAGFKGQVSGQIATGRERVVQGGDAVQEPTPGAVGAARSADLARIREATQRMGADYGTSPLVQQANQAQQDRGREMDENGTKEAIDKAHGTLNPGNSRLGLAAKQLAMAATPNQMLFDDLQGVGQELYNDSRQLQAEVPAEARDYFAAQYAQGLARMSGGVGDPTAVANAAAGLTPGARQAAERAADRMVDQEWNGPQGGGPIRQALENLTTPGAGPAPAPPPLDAGPNNPAPPPLAGTSGGGGARSEQAAAKAVATLPGQLESAQGQAYAPLVYQEALRQGVDPYLAVAVAARESQFDPNASSPKGAVGLMQLTAGTSADMGLDPAARTDPARNAAAGVRYLAKMLREHDDNVDLALAAYNAGPGTIQKYGNTIPPYRETEEYVAAVTAMRDALRQAEDRTS